MPFWKNTRTAIGDLLATITPEALQNTIRLFMDVEDGKLKAKKPDDTVIDLEAGGAAIPTGWRFIEDSGKLKLQKNIASVWTTVHEFSIG